MPWSKRFRFPPFLLLVSLWVGSGAACAQTVPGVPLKIALLQMEPFGNDQARNFEKAESYCRKAAQGGADIALMPEMFSIGYTRFDAEKVGAREEFWKQAVPTSHASIQQFAAVAKDTGMAIAVTYLKQGENLPENAVTLFDRNGREVITYSKVHTSDFKPMEASMTPGEDFFVGTLDTRAGPVEVGAMICFDREQPESARILMLKGAELILTPNACKLDDLRLDQFKIRAWENVVDVAMANYPAPNQNGHSVAYCSDGETAVEAGEEEGIYYATFDLDTLRKNRLKRIWGNAYRRPHRYGILSEPEQGDVWKRIDGNGKPYNPGTR